MTLIYIPPLQVTSEQLDMLEESYKAAPVWDRWTRLEIAEALLSGRCTLFDLGGKGIMMCSVRESNGHRVLNMEAACAKGRFVRSWLQDMKRLAADWACDAIQTTAFDSRLARAIVLSGAQVEATVLMLQVGR